MARLNVRTKLSTHEGAKAPLISPYEALRRSVMCCLLWEDEFYESGETIAKRIEELCKKIHFEQICELAVTAKHDYHLRHVPLFLMVQVFRKKDVFNVSKEDFATAKRNSLDSVITRPDDLSEFLALYWKDGKCPLAAQAKKGLASAFSRFNEYQLAKYDRGGPIKLRDVLFLCHAKPRDSQQAELWKRLVNGELTIPDTWEVALSAGEDKRETWTRLLTENKLGGLALLRNLRNMVNANVKKDVIRNALREHRFKNVLPFRFLSAAKAMPEFEPELEVGMLSSIQDSPKLNGKTVILVDHSGSMAQPLSSKSDLNRLEVACSLAILAREVCDNVSIFAFTTQTKLVPSRRGFALRDAIDTALPLGATDVQQAKHMADLEGYDRIIIITDEQSTTPLNAPKMGATGYLINVASNKNGIGYGDWVHIDGWSEEILRFIYEHEQFCGE